MATINTTTHQETIEATTNREVGPSEYIGMAVHPDTGKMNEYQQLATSSTGKRWQTAFSKEWG
jgi:hypothetical protein